MLTVPATGFDVQRPGANATPSRAWLWLANGTLAIVCAWTLMALWHYYTGMTHLYGFIDIGVNNKPPFWGSIKNPNHGAFLQLMGTSLAVALGFAELSRRGSDALRSGRPWFYLAVALFLTFATFQTVSRGAIVLTLLFWLFAGCLGLFWGWRRKVKGVVPAFALVLVLIVGGAVSFVWLNLESGKNRDFRSAFGATVAQWTRGGDMNRVILNRVALRYYRRNSWMGTGLGSWGYFYRQYIEKGESRISVTRRGWSYDPETRKRVPKYIPFQFWHSHNDWLQYLCELGAMGSIPLLLIIVWFVKQSIRLAIFVSYDLILSSLLLFVGGGLMAIASVYEFPSRTPALGLMMAALLGKGMLMIGVERYVKK